MDYPAKSGTCSDDIKSLAHKAHIHLAVFSLKAKAPVLIMDKPSRTVLAARACAAGDILLVPMTRRVWIGAGKIPGNGRAVSYGQVHAALMPDLSPDFVEPLWAVKSTKEEGEVTVE